MPVPPMLNPSRRYARFAFIFASLSFFCVAALFAAGEAEPLYYIYHGQPKALRLDAHYVAVHVKADIAGRPSAGALPKSLADRGFTDSDVLAKPQAGWIILNAQKAVASANATARSSATTSAPQTAASSVHVLVTSLLNSGDPRIEFVSPLFRDEGGDPIVLTPTLLI